MPFDGSGNYTPAAAPNFPAISGTVISAAYYNAVINDLATAMSNTLTRDGQGRPTAAINWNAKNLTNVADFGAVNVTVSGNLTAASPLFTATGAVGGLAGNAQTMWRTTVLAGTNTNDVFLREERVSNGSDWTTTRSRLNTRIDATFQTYIDLRTDTSTPGIAFGTGPAGTLLERMRITQSGDVGIGTATPGRRLSIAGGGFAFDDATTVPRSIHWGNGTTYNLLMVGDATNGFLSFQTNTPGVTGVDRMRLTAAGWLGINTTTPDSFLDVNGSQIIRGDTNGFALFVPKLGTAPFGANYDRFEVRVDTSLQVTTIGNTNGGTGLARALAFLTGNTERMRITTGGDVAIGTANVQARFHVNTAVNRNLLVRTAATLGTGVSIFSVNDANNAVQGMEFGASSYFFSGGNVGIGVSNPATILDIGAGVLTGKRYASPTLNNSYIDLTDTGGGDPGFNFDSSDGLTYNRTANQLRMSIGGNTKFTVDAGGVGDELGNLRRLIKAAATSGVLTAASANQWVRATAGVTINNSVFSPNDFITIVNKSGGAITITQGVGITITDAFGNTGNRTLANHGICTIIFNTASDAVISGSNLT